MNHRNEPDALTEAELDAFLAFAHTDLLRRLQQSIDPAAGLLGLWNEPATPPTGSAAATRAAHIAHAQAVIKARALAHMPGDPSELCQAVYDANLFRDVKDIAFLLSMSVAIASALETGIVQGLGRERELVLAFARDLGIDVEVHSASDCIRAFLHVPDRTRGRILDHVRDLMGRPAHELARLLASSPGLIGGHAREVARMLVLTLNQCLVLALAKALDLVLVDASGMDLSHLHVEVEALAGVVWTVSTVWAQDMREAVEERSQEIRSGVYQVRGGSEHDPQGALLA